MSAAATKSPGVVNEKMRKDKAVAALINIGSDRATSVYDALAKRAGTDTAEVIVRLEGKSLGQAFTKICRNLKPQIFWTNGFVELTEQRDPEEWPELLEKDTASPQYNITAPYKETDCTDDVMKKFGPDSGSQRLIERRVAWLEEMIGSIQTSQMMQGQELNTLGKITEMIPVQMKAMQRAMETDMAAMMSQFQDMMAQMAQMQQKHQLNDKKT